MAREVDYPIAGAIGVGDPLFLRNGMGTAETTRDGRSTQFHSFAEKVIRFLPAGCRKNSNRGKVSFRSASFYPRRWKSSTGSIEARSD